MGGMWNKININKIFYFNQVTCVMLKIKLLDFFVVRYHKDNIKKFSNGACIASNIRMDIFNLLTICF